MRTWLGVLLQREVAGEQWRVSRHHQEGWQGYPEVALSGTATASYLAGRATVRSPRSASAGCTITGTAVMGKNPRTFIPKASAEIAGVHLAGADR